jgi:chorismate dehydratase
LDGLAVILEASRDDGLANLEQIAQNESASHGLTKEDVHRYFAENLHFRLGPGERLGLEAFRSKALGLGLIPEHAPFVV